MMSYSERIDALAEAVSTLTKAAELLYSNGESNAEQACLTLARQYQAEQMEMLDCRNKSLEIEQ